MKKIGIFLIVLSFVLYALILAVPVLPFSVKAKAGITGALVAAGEASFWIGGLLVGRELVRRFRYRLNPVYWFSKSKKANAETEKPSQDS